MKPNQWATTRPANMTMSIGRQLRCSQLPCASARTICKAADKAGLADGVRLKDCRDGMAQELDLKALHGLVFIKVLEAPGAAHPDYAALHLGTHQSPGMTVAAKSMPTNSVSIMLTLQAEKPGLKMSVT